jgi:outer membrane receptor protein involved in Fe transport
VRASVGVDGATGIGVGLSPTLGVRWRPRPSLRLWARAGRAFRLPTFGDVFLRSGNGTRSDPDLRPERVELDSEIGARVTGGDSGFGAGVTAFLRLTRDPILWLPSVVSVWTPINGGFLRARGVEASVGWVPAPGWQVGLNGTIQSSRLGFDGYANPLPYQAHLSSRASLERRGPGPDAREEIEVRGPRRTSMFGPQQLPAVALVGIRGRQELTVAGFDAVLEVGVSNVLDAAYERVELFPEPGRRFEIRIDVGTRSPESLP